MKFMRVAKEKQVQKDMDDAYKLINQLENEDSQQIGIDSDEEDSQHNNLNQRKKSGHNDEQEISRKVYGVDKPDGPKAHQDGINNKK